MSLLNLNYLKPFKYDPIDPSHRVFRLVWLLPPKPALIPGLSGTLRVKIVHVHIDSVVSYDALSYAWNTPRNPTTPNRRIIVETKDGSRGLYIHRPLELALYYLVATNTTNRPLFIDQISINQTKPTEKSHQVQLMRDIYTRCSRTVVWLGPPNRASDRYFNYVREISHEGVLSRVMGPRVGHFAHVLDAVMDTSLEVNTEEREDRDDLLDMIRRFGDRFPLDGFADVLDRHWFNRLWIIQEACLAPAVVLICGYQSLCFDCFRSGKLFYNIHSRYWIRQQTDGTPQSELRLCSDLFDKGAAFTRIFQERKAIHHVGRRQGLYDIMLKYNVNNHLEKIGASIEADRIFGLLGLAADDDALRQRIYVSYETKVVQIYTEVAALLLEENIDTLLFAQFPKKTEDQPPHIKKLPSWVPDWAMDLTIPVGYSDLTHPVFSAGGPKEGARFEVNQLSSQLMIQGVLVDKIMRVGKRSHRVNPETQLMEWLDYRWAKMFFDEVSDFVREADIAANGQDHFIEDEEMRSQKCLRLCDSGLSYEYFTERLGLSPGIERLKALHSAIGDLGQRLLRSDDTVASYHITRISRIVGITPRCRMSVSELCGPQLCALDAIRAVKIVCKALVDFVTDMFAFCIASARVSFASYYAKLRRRFSKINGKVNREAAERVGLDPNVSFGPDMNEFISNLLKNSSRKLFLTERGYVGLGPAQMTPGDVVVVLYGGTTPHVLRVTEDKGTGNGVVYEYLGEAYCDGIMNGEVLEAGTESERHFTIA